MVYGTLGVVGNTTLGTLTANNINFTGSLTSNGSPFSSSPSGLNSSGNIGIGGSSGSTTLLVTGTQSNTGTLGVAGKLSLGGTFSANAVNAPIYLSGSDYYSQAGSYPTTTPITISAGPPAFNGNGSEHVSANDLLLQGQDLSWVGNSAAAASILLQSGRSINASQNSDNQIQFNTAGGRRGYFNENGLTVNGTLNTCNATFGTSSSARTDLIINTNSGQWVNYFPTVTGGGLKERAWNLFYYPQSGGILPVWDIQPQSNLFYTSLNFESGGNLTATGTLYSAGGFRGKFITNEWMYSTDNRARLLYYNNSDSVYGSGSRHYFRNSDDINVVNFDGVGSITASGGIIASGNSGLTPILGTGSSQTITTCITGGGITLGRFFADDTPVIYGNSKLTLQSANGTVAIMANNLSVGGSVGIGTGTPVCPLDVATSVNISVSSGYQIHAGGAQGWGQTNDFVSIKASGIIWTTNRFVVSSDQRIKKNILPAIDALDVVNKLNIVSFDHIDNMNAPVKHGLIAQQVQAIYPEAVSKNKNYIPSINSLGTYKDASDNVIITSANHGLIIGDKIKLYINQDDDPDTVDLIYEPIVLQVTLGTFTVKKWDDFELNKTMLIYGKEVNDFLGVDKQQIGVLAAGACQTLSGQVSSLKAENLAQASTIANMKSTINAMLEKYPL
jgi:hypothetical protein